MKLEIYIILQCILQLHAKHSWPRLPSHWKYTITCIVTTSTCNRSSIVIMKFRFSLSVRCTSSELVSGATWSGCLFSPQYSWINTITDILCGLTFLKSIMMVKTISIHVFSPYSHVFRQRQVRMNTCSIKS